MRHISYSNSVAAWSITARWLIVHKIFETQTGSACSTVMDGIREYRMTYRGPGFLVVVWCGPSPPGKLERRHTGRLRKRDKLLMRKGEGEWARNRIIQLQESLVLYKSFNTLRMAHSTWNKSLCWHLTEKYKNPFGTVFAFSLFFFKSSFQIFLRLMRGQPAGWLAQGWM
jgi:hypothetical protein